LIINKIATILTCLKHPPSNVTLGYINVFYSIFHAFSLVFWRDGMKPKQKQILVTFLSF